MLFYGFNSNLKANIDVKHISNLKLTMDVELMYENGKTVTLLASSIALVSDFKTIIFL